MAEALPPGRSRRDRYRIERAGNGCGRARGERAPTPTILLFSSYLGTIGHVAHGKSTVVKAISGVQTVRFKNELERNITIKLGYANAKIYRAADPACPRPWAYRAYGSSKEDAPACDVPGFEGTKMELLRHVSFVDCPGERGGGAWAAVARRHGAGASRGPRPAAMEERGGGGARPRSPPTPHTPSPAPARPRHPDGHHAQRRGRHGRRPAAHRGQRVVPPTPNLRTPRRRRNHAPAAHPHPAEQGRPHFRVGGEQPARRDHRFRAGHHRGGRPRRPHLGPAQVQRGRGVRVHRQEDSGAGARFHVAAADECHSVL